MRNTINTTCARCSPKLSPSPCMHAPAFTQRPRLVARTRTASRGHDVVIGREKLTRLKRVQPVSTRCTSMRHAHEATRLCLCAGACYCNQKWSRQAYSASSAQDDGATAILVTLLPLVYLRTKNVFDPQAPGLSLSLKNYKTFL
jgi:hypothetical protein